LLIRDMAADRLDTVRCVILREWRAGFRLRDERVFRMVG